MKVFEFATNGLGLELCLIDPQENLLDVVAFGKFDAREVLETGVPLVGIISEETFCTHP